MGADTVRENSAEVNRGAIASRNEHGSRVFPPEGSQKIIGLTFYDEIQFFAVSFLHRS
jgi:hypothetical protein